jgi:hypothetical protein
VKNRRRRRNSERTAHRPSVLRASLQAPESTAVCRKLDGESVDVVDVLFVDAPVRTPLGKVRRRRLVVVVVGRRYSVKTKIRTKNRRRVRRVIRTHKVE